MTRVGGGFFWDCFFGAAGPEEVGAHALAVGPSFATGTAAPNASPLLVSVGSKLAHDEATADPRSVDSGLQPTRKRCSSSIICANSLWVTNFSVSFPSSVSLPCFLGSSADGAAALLCSGSTSTALLRRRDSEEELDADFSCSCSSAA